MQKIECDILIIGGGPAGGVSAVSARTSYPQKKIVVIRDLEVQLVPCAIPYIFGETLGCSDKNVASCAMAEKMNIDTFVDKVQRVDIEKKVAYSPNYEISFEKLIFATGSTPFVHDSLQHSLALEGVFSVPKNKTLIDKMKNYSQNVEDIVIVGTGFIGIELAMEFAESGKRVSVVGGATSILKNAFDAEVAQEAQEILKANKIEFIGGDRVTSIVDKNGDGIVNGVALKSGKVVDAQMVVLATGYKPNTTLAEESGISLGHYGGIWVDEYMRTQNHDIFAVGDCSSRRDFITKEPSKVMLASTSSAEGRVAGTSLYGIQYLKGFSGTIAIFSTMLGDVAFSSAGLTQEQAQAAGIDVVVGSFSGLNRHPQTIPDAQRQFVKLIAMKNGGQIIGGQIIGGKETGEMINIIGTMIESKFDVYQVMSMQVATQPMLTAAPTSYPITMAAINIVGELHSN